MIFSDDVHEIEVLLIAAILTDPNKSRLPDIFMFLAPNDFMDEKLAAIFEAFQKVYSGMALDSKDWIKRAFEYASGNETEKRIEWRGIADCAVSCVGALDYAHQVKEDYLRRAIAAAVDNYAKWKIEHAQT